MNCLYGWVPPVMAWMATRPDAVECAAPRQVLPSLAKFGSALVELREKWHDHAPWTHVVVEAQNVAREAGLIPTVAE